MPCWCQTDANRPHVSGLCLSVLPSQGHCPSASIAVVSATGLLGLVLSPATSGVEGPGSRSGGWRMRWALDSETRAPEQVQGESGALALRGGSVPLTRKLPLQPFMSPDGWPPAFAFWPSGIPLSLHGLDQEKPTVLPHGILVLMWRGLFVCVF